MWVKLRSMGKPIGAYKENKRLRRKAVAQLCRDMPREARERYEKLAQAVKRWKASPVDLEEPCPWCGLLIEISPVDGLYHAHHDDDCIAFGIALRRLGEFDEPEPLDVRRAS